MRACTRMHVMKSCPEINNEVVASALRGFVENYASFLMDVTILAFRRSPVANKNSTELVMVVRTVNTGATEKASAIVVWSRVRDLHHILLYMYILLYVYSHLSDRDSYSSIDAEVNVEISACQGPCCDVQ